MDKKYRKTMPIKMDIDSLKEAQRAYIPTVTIIKGCIQSKRIEIKENRKYVIGREIDNDIMLDDSSTSRYHAEIWTEWEGNERIIWLKDLGSTNKTMLNGKEISSVELSAGDKIFIGESLLLFETQDSIVAKFYKEIHDKAEESGIDPLTELLSKRFFLNALPKMYEEMVATGRCFSLIILDLDHFKEVNDNLGHDTGDKVLQILAKIVKNSIRKEDLAMRYGGDEIVIGLPNTTLKSAYEIAERLRLNVQSFDSSLLNGKKLSVSVGVCSNRGKQGERTKFDEIMRCADAALYKSKEKGRNSVTTEEEICV